MRAAFGKHQLIFAADFREVIPFNLAKVLTNLQASLTSEDGTNFYYFGVVQSTYFDENVNAERTGFSIPARAEEDDLYEEPTLLEVRDECARHVATDLQPFTARIEEEKTRRLQNFVQGSQPKYRPFLNRYRDEVLCPIGCRSRNSRWVCLLRCHLETDSNESMYQRISSASVGAPCWARTRVVGFSSSTSRFLAQVAAAAR
jgi:hypothetical protein